MSLEVINVGAHNNDPTADSIRTGGIKINANFAALAASSAGWQSVQQYGAVGDGVTDDTAAIQLAIDTTFALGYNLYVPTSLAHNYLITDTLTVGAVYSAPSIRSGWKMFGDGQGGNGAGGTVIRFNATGKTAILKIDGGTAWRNISVEDMTLLFAAGSSATYGLLNNSTEISQPRFSVKIDCETSVSAKAFATLADTGVNGEFAYYNNCKAFNVGGFYYTNAGQAFQPLFNNCYGFLNAGGIHFDIDIGLSVPGGGFTAINYNGGAAHPSGISNTVLLRNNGNTSAVTFVGGRVEHITQPYLNAEYTTGGTAIRTPNTTFRDMELTCDFDASNGALTLANAVAVAGGETLKFDSCHFEADIGAGTPTNITFPVNYAGNGNGYWGNTVFEDCVFTQFVQPPTLSGYEGGIDGSVRFDRCRVGIISATLSEESVTTGWEQFADYAQLHGRSVNGDNLFVQVGAPENQITNCQIASTNGAAVVPLSPWVLTGAANIGIQDWNGSPKPRSTSPYSRLITLPAGATLYQDISGIDLIGGPNVINGRGVSYVTWELLVNELGGTTTGDFAILDSVTTSKVYVSRNFSTNGTIVYARPIRLAVGIESTGTHSHPRIRIRNTGASPLTLDLSWQYVGSTYNPTFEGTLTPDGVQQDVATIEQLTLWAGLNVPYVADKYGGFGASNAIPNSKGRLYVASDDNKLTYADGTNYHKILLDPFAGFNAPVYGTTVTIDVTQQTVSEIIVTDAVNFIISNPINPLYTGQQIVIQVKNLTVGALGTATFSANYKLGAAWSQPATGKNRSIGFYWDGQFWYETWRSAADVAN